MQDHYVARVSYPVVGPQTSHKRSRGLPLAGEGMRWLLTGKGMLTYSPSIDAPAQKTTPFNCHNRMIYEAIPAVGATQNVMANPAFFGAMRFGLVAPTTISGNSTCSHPEETGR